MALFATYALREAFGQAVGVGVDLSGSLWFQQWLAYCLQGGFWPGHTPWFFAPDGLDLFSQTGFNFLDAVGAVPLLWALGMPDYHVPWTVVLLVGNAMAMRSLLASQGASRPAALAGAWVFAFHPYVVFELNEGRPTQAMLWFWPLAVRELLAMRDDPRWRRAVAAGVFLALQGWTYWFTAHFIFLVFGPVIVLHARGAGRDWWMRMGAAGSVALLLVVPAMVPMLWLWNTGGVEGVVQGFGGFGLEDPKAVGLGWWLELLPGKSLALTVLVLVLAPRRRLWGVGAAVVGVLALGNTLWIPGTDGIPNPAWHLCEAVLPAFSRLLFPYRIWSALAVLAALALAESLDRVPGGARRWAAAVVAVWAGVAVGNPRGGMFIGTPVPRPAYVDAVREAPGTVLDLPFLCAEEAVVYQPLHGQALAGGMTENVPALRPEGVVERLEADPLLSALGRASLGQDPGTAGDLGLPVRWVVLHTELLRRSDQVKQCWKGPETNQMDAVARAALIRLLGPPHMEDREAVAWDLGIRR